MIRVTCPSCQRAHDFLDLYRGLTIVCKHCRGGIPVAKDAPSLPEEEIQAVQPAPALAPPEFAPTEDPAPTQAHAPRSVSQTDDADPPAPPRHKAAYHDDAPRQSNKRTLILGSALVLILLAGGGLVARSYWQQRNNTIAINLKHSDPKPKPEKKTDNSEPKSEPKVVIEEKKPAALAPDVAVLDWYTTKQVQFEKPSAVPLPDPKSVGVGGVFLVVHARLSGKALAAKDGDEKLALSAKQFAVVDEDGQKLFAIGFDVDKGTPPKDKDFLSLSAQIDVADGSESAKQDVGVLFIVPEDALADDAISFQFGAFPAATLAASKRKPTPSFPIAKKEEPKAPASKPGGAVEVVDWYSAEEIPDSEMGMMQLSASDKARKYEFFVVKLKFAAKAVAATNEDAKGFAVNLFSKDFAVLLDEEKVANHRLGLEDEGGFGASKGAGYRVNESALIKAPQAPTHHVHEVFFTAPKGAAETGKLQVQYRDYEPVTLAKERRREPPEPVVKKPPETKKQPDPVEAPKANDDVVVLEWRTADKLPGNDPETKSMPLTASDRAAGNIFVVVKVKLAAKAITITKGEVRWTARCEAKDFTLVDADEKKHAAGGLEQNGTFGDTVGAGYLANLNVLVLFDEAPDHVVQTVFFTVPRRSVIADDVELRYREYPPLALTKMKQKK